MKPESQISYLFFIRVIRVIRGLKRKPYLNI